VIFYGKKRGSAEMLFIATYLTTTFLTNSHSPEGVTLDAAIAKFLQELVKLLTKVKAGALMDD